jgi:hypothetical protein|tara:strand:+ start:1069 stop:1308 length:240 start_codon:yes stop_codon:yes gene_type:complete
MKKLLILSSLTILLFSCKGNYEDIEECYCGEIISDDAADYSIVAMNECTGNEQKFILNYDDWVTAFIGTDYCISNPEGW